MVTLWLKNVFPLKSDLFDLFSHVDLCIIAANLIFYLYPASQMMNNDAAVLWEMLCVEKQPVNYVQTVRTAIISAAIGYRCGLGHTKVAHISDKKISLMSSANIGMPTRKFGFQFNFTSQACLSNLKKNKWSELANIKFTVCTHVNVGQYLYNFWSYEASLHSVTKTTTEKVFLPLSFTGAYSCTGFLSQW